MKIDFINGYLNDEVYVKNLKKFVAPCLPNRVYKLIKALYKLKQALRSWYERLTKFLTMNGYAWGGFDKTPFVYKLWESFDSSIYVDDNWFGWM